MLQGTHEPLTQFWDNRMSFLTVKGIEYSNVNCGWRVVLCHKNRSFKVLMN